MSSHREAILAAAIATMVTASVAGGRIFRSRTDALTAGEIPAIVVMPAGERIEHSASRMAVRRLSFRVECHARGNPPDLAADAVLVAAHAALMADTTLGGLCRSLIDAEVSEPDFIEGDDSACRIATTYTATYITPAGDLTRQST